MDGFLITYLILGITVITSFLAFNNDELFNRLKFNAYLVYHRKDWKRLLTHGLLHADFFHLLVNMFVLFSFGRSIENIFTALYKADKIAIPSQSLFLLFYLSALVISSLPSMFKHKNNHYYNAVGASGAVSAVVFASIFFAPTTTLTLYIPIPIPLPAFVFGILYLGYSFYMSRKQVDNIGHDAHFYGAVYGFCFPIIIQALHLNNPMELFNVFK